MKKEIRDVYVIVDKRDGEVAGVFLKDSGAGTVPAVFANKNEALKHLVFCPNSAKLYKVVLATITLTPKVKAVEKKITKAKKNKNGK